MPISPIPEILDELRRGRMVILVDDPGRENEGDLAMLAEQVTPEAINFMAREGRGLICMPMAGELCDQLGLHQQVSHNTSKHGTGFTVSIEAAQGVTTGISAADRAHTIRTAVRPDARSEDLARPGHVFPLRARDGGVLVRGGQTEGIVDLARLCGRRAAGVICEIMNDDGTMARMAELERFAQRHGLKICTIADLIAWRRQNEGIVDLARLCGRRAAGVICEIMNDDGTMGVCSGQESLDQFSDGDLGMQWPRSEKLLHIGLLKDTIAHCLYPIMTLPVLIR